MSDSLRPEEPAATLGGGELNAAITRALVGIHQRYLGRGPATASTFHYDNIVVTLMYGVLTLAEQSLASGSHAEAVVNMRNAFQDVMSSEFTAAVERLSGRRVVDFVSGSNIDAGIASEIFVLDSCP